MMNVLSPSSLAILQLLFLFAIMKASECSPGAYIQYQLPRNPVSASWQKNLGNRKNSGNCCTYTGTIGSSISMGIRGDPVKTKQDPGGHGRPVGAPFGVNKGAGVPGLFQPHQV